MEKRLFHHQIQAFQQKKPVITPAIIPIIRIFFELGFDIGSGSFDLIIVLIPAINIIVDKRAIKISVEKRLAQYPPIGAKATADKASGNPILKSTIPLIEYLIKANPPFKPFNKSDNGIAISTRGYPVHFNSGT